MEILSRNTLELGGFAGLTEHRLVTDERLFGKRKQAEVFNGLGNFVYLADAKFNPTGETGMHPHKEIDVISVMIEGRVSHEGSLAHGQGLETGDVQVQRAGGEGFSHNEVNPDNTKNRMIQLWVLPEEEGRPAGYKYYSPALTGTTRVYGGNKQQSETFASNTVIEITKLQAGSKIKLSNETICYITSGTAEFKDNSHTHQAKDGDLIRSSNAEIQATTNTTMIVVS